MELFGNSQLAAVTERVSFIWNLNRGVAVFNHIFEFNVLIACEHAGVYVPISSLCREEIVVCAEVGYQTNFFVPQIFKLGRTPAELRVPVLEVF